MVTFRLRTLELRVVIAALAAGEGRKILSRTRSAATSEIVRNFCIMVRPLPYNDKRKGTDCAVVLLVYTILEFHRNSFSYYAVVKEEEEPCGVCSNDIDLHDALHMCAIFSGISPLLSSPTFA